MCSPGVECLSEVRAVGGGPSRMHTLHHFTEGARAHLHLVFVGVLEPIPRMPRDSCSQVVSFSPGVNVVKVPCTHFPHVLAYLGWSPWAGERRVRSPGGPGLPSELLLVCTVFLVFLSSVSRIPQSAPECAAVTPLSAW